MFDDAQHVVPDYPETDPYFDRIEAESAQRAARVTIQAETAKPIDDPSQLPHLLNGDLPQTAEEIAAVMEKGPVSIADFWDVKVERITPTLMEIEGEDRCLFYRAKTNSVTGEAGKGKSLLVQKTVAKEAAAKRHAMFIDYEKDLQTFLQRMKDHGVTREDAKYILYWRPTKALHMGVIQTVLKYVELIDLDVVVIDSVSRAMSRAALDENSNKEFRSWFETGPELLALAGATPIQVDHTKKPEHRDGKAVASSDRNAKGAVAKIEATTGTAIVVRTAKPFSVNQAGHAILTCGKDNNGQWTEGEIMAEMHVSPMDDGKFGFELRKSTSQVVDEATGEKKFRPTNRMEAICRLLEQEGDPMGVGAIKRALGGNGQAVGIAIDRLAEEDFVDAPEAAPGKTRMVTLKHVFTEATDPKNPSANPFGATTSSSAPKIDPGF